MLIANSDLRTNWLQILKGLVLMTEWGCTDRCAISQQRKKQNFKPLKSSRVFFPEVVSSRLQKVGLQDGCCERCSLSPAQRKERLLSRLYLERWPCFSALPLSVTTNLQADSSVSLRSRCSVYSRQESKFRIAVLVSDLLFSCPCSPPFMKGRVKPDPLTLLYKSKHSSG